MDSIFLRGKLCLHPHLLSPGCWVTHLSTAVAWREKNSKHFVSCKYFCLILGLLKSRISKKSLEGLGRKLDFKLFSLRPPGCASSELAIFQEENIPSKFSTFSTFYKFLIFLINLLPLGNKHGNFFWIRSVQNGPNLIKLDQIRFFSPIKKCYYKKLSHLQNG